MFAGFLLARALPDVERGQRLGPTPRTWVIGVAFAVATGDVGIRIAADSRVCLARFALALSRARLSPAFGKVEQPVSEPGHCVLLSWGQPYARGRARVNSEDGGAQRGGSSRTVRSYLVKPGHSAFTGCDIGPCVFQGAHAWRAFAEALGTVERIGDDPSALYTAPVVDFAIA